MYQIGTLKYSAFYVFGRIIEDMGILQWWLKTYIKIRQMEGNE